MKTAVIIGFLIYSIYTYFRFKRKNKLINELRKTISDTHDYYRNRYDFYLNFKERYFDLLSQVQDYKEYFVSIGIPEPSPEFLKPLEEKQIEDLPVIKKVRKPRKPKVE